MPQVKACSFTLFFLLHTVVVLAQTPLNGQIFTNGLSIINAPALNSEHNAGGNIPISIEVSGNGKLPFAALTPGSRLDTAYEEINIFLVSSQTNVNFTVSIGPNLLTDESGTVRHLNYQIPRCIRPGQYNMTFYETSTLETQPLYVITPIPISIRNPSPSGECTEGVNTLEAQPQPDTRAPQSPFLPGSVVLAPSPTIWTVTMTGGRQFPTAPRTDGPLTTATMVVETPVTTVPPGQTRTTTSMMTFTTTATMSPEDFSKFLPVTSSAGRTISSRLLFTPFAIGISTVFCVRHIGFRWL